MVDSAMTRTERTYYGIFALYNFSWSFLGPVYALFLLSRGLDLFEINVVLATYLITSFAFEVPTGALADLAGRKTSFLLSCVVRMAAFGLYAYSSSFPRFILAEFIDAIGSTLASGALEAWAVDGMHAEGQQRPPDRFFARAQMLSRTVMIVSGVTSGYLGDYDLTLPWLVAVGGFACTGVVATISMHEPQRVASAGWRGLHRSLGRTAREGMRIVWRAPVLLLLCGITLVASFGVMPIQMLWQPRMQQVTGQGVWIMGWIWALLNIAAVAGSAVIPRLLIWVRRERVLAAAALWRAAMLVVAGTAGTASPAVGGLLLQEVSTGLSEPLIQAWMNEHITAERRATVLSVRAMCFTLGGAGGLVCLGLIARDVGMSTAWVLAAFAIALTTAGFVRLGRLAGCGRSGEIETERLAPSAAR